MGLSENRYDQFQKRIPSVDCVVYTAGYHYDVNSQLIPHTKARVDAEGNFDVDSSEDHHSSLIRSNAPGAGMNSKMELYRHVSRVMYDGSRFRGWQDQSSTRERTVQGTIGKFLSERCDRVVRVVGASRTDLGVHARGQVIHFDLPEVADFLRLEYVMNRLLPPDIKLYNTTLAPHGTAQQVVDNEPFHATKSATGKLYSYSFTTNTFVDPLDRHRCTHVYAPIDLNALEQSLQLCVGTHDFRAFTNRVEQSSRRQRERVFSTTRTIHSIAVVEKGDRGGGHYEVQFRIESALYKMIRNIMGAALDVAGGRNSLEWMQHLLTTAPSRNDNKSKAAPPQGLCLERVFYDHF